MKSKRVNPTKFLGIITVASAIGIMVLQYISNGTADSFIMPFILVCFAAVMYFNKTEKKMPEITIDNTKGKILLSVASITLVSGIVVLILKYL